MMTGVIALINKPPVFHCHSAREASFTAPSSAGRAHSEYEVVHPPLEADPSPNTSIGSSESRNNLHYFSARRIPSTTFEGPTQAATH